MVRHYDKKKILLVNPWIHDFAAHDHWAKPMGLLYIASLLRQSGYQTEYVDCLTLSDTLGAGAVPRGKRRGDGRGAYRKEQIARPDILRDIPRRYSRYGMPPLLVRRSLEGMAKPDLVLVTSFMTYWYPGVTETIGLVRSTWKDVPIVLGGIYATLCPEHAARHSGADRIVCGDGIPQLEGLLSDILGDSPGLAANVDDPDGLPFPAFDLVPDLDQVPILTSRGCPRRCTYCASHRIQPRFLRRDPRAVADEIAWWHETYGISDFSFYDDALLVDPPRMIRPLLGEILRRGIRVRFHSPNGLHLREVDEEVAGLLRRSGFRTLRFGLETVDEARQLDSGGKAGTGDLEKAMYCLTRAAYGRDEVGVYLLCGLPGQPPGEIEAGIRTVKACGARPILAEYSPIPGTGLWDAAVRASRYPIAEEPLFQNNTLLPCAVPELTLECYRELKRMALDAGP